MTDPYYEDPYDPPAKGAVVWTDEDESLSAYAVKNELEIEFQYPDYSDVDNSLATCEDYMYVSDRDDLLALRDACKDLRDYILSEGIDRDTRLILLNGNDALILLNIDPDNEYWEIGMFVVSDYLSMTSYSGLFYAVDGDRPFLLIEDESGHDLLDFLDKVSDECDKALDYKEATPNE